MAKLIVVALGIIVSLCHIVGSQVIELDDSFPEKRGDTPWLVEFYAPWCGHCKRLEPTFHQVSLTLRTTDIRVGKIDATRFSSLASEFDVRGYPTIKFLQGDQSYAHRGDRSLEGIVEFAKRAKGPAVRILSNLGRLNDAKGEHADGVFFLYIGDLKDADADLYLKYKACAEKYAVLSYFYAAEKHVIPQDIKYKNTPTVLVFKDGEYTEYAATGGGIIKSELDDWINGERFPAFPKVTAGGLNELAEFNKRVVMVSVDGKDKINYALHERFKDMGRLLATKNKRQFGKNYQFVWLNDDEAVNSITMSTMDLPNIIILEPETQFYYIPEINMKELTYNSLSGFLNQVMDGTLQAHGGSGFFQRLKRVFYDISMTIYGVYETSVWLALLVFGLPTTIISIVCYALCCMEPIEESDYDEDLDDEDEEVEDGPTPTKSLEDKSNQPVQDDSSENDNSDADGHLKKE